MSGLGRRVRSPRSGRVVGVIASILALFVALQPSFAHAARKGILWVRVIDTKTGKPVQGVEVSIKDRPQKAITDKTGEAEFELDEGKYHVSLVKDGYYNSIYPNVEVISGKQSQVECELVAGDPSQQFFFGIGGVNVVGKKDLLPVQIETTHEITSAEIEHNLSTNLGDVLMLVPGVEKSQPPGLSKQSQVEFRGTGFMGVEEQAAALFGTKVIIDGIRISNNANLQTGTGTATSTTSTSAGTGIDLRTIPADNIERVEVITGVPSVEYGDMTTGVVKVETKKEKQPHRLKIKSNPDTKEGNLSGGLEPKNIGLSYNLNYAYSERDIRRKGDEYSRYSGQVTVRNRFLGERASLLNKLFYTGVIDEMDLNPNDPQAMQQSNKDKTYLYGLTFDFKKSNKTKFFGSGSVQYTKRDSYYQRLVGADTRVLTDSEEEGTREGILSAGAYVSKVWTKGEEWTVDGKATVRKDFDLLNVGNSLLGGAEYTYDDNVGPGQIFNPLEPPSGQTGRRPLPFDASPALYTANLYLEDEIEGFLLKRAWTADVGFRYEMYRPEKINFGNLFGSGGFVESKNGTFLNPRVRLRYDLSKDTRIRMSWGKSSKMPPMTTIYQGPNYLDVVEENVSPPDSVPLITTYIYHFDNDRLIGYQNEKAELSLDQKVGSVAGILTGFYSKSDHTPRSIQTPITVFRYRWEGWPDPNTRTAIDTIYTDNDKRFYENRGWTETWGAEGQFSTSRIDALSTIFKVNASFVRDRWGAEGSYMSSPRAISALGGRIVYPYYHYDAGWSQKLIINYSADWLFEKVGMWTTFFVQQTLFDYELNKDDPNLYATGYYDPLSHETVPVSPEASDSLGLTRKVDSLDTTVSKAPNDRFLFNINVTKSLGRGTEMSLFVYNVFDDAAYYMNEYGYWTARNHDIFYGLELSVVLDDFFKRRGPEAR